MLQLSNEYQFILSYVKENFKKSVLWYIIAKSIGQNTKQFI